MESLTVHSLGGDRFVIGIRGFGMEVDQPLEAGGTDMGPTPTELFVGSLAACVAFYAGRYLRRHQLPADHLAVDRKFQMSDASPHRVTKIDIELKLPASLTEHERAVLLKVVDACTVHNSLRQTPAIRISLAKEPQTRETASSLELVG